MYRLIIASLLFVASPAGASTECIDIDNDLDRLACYDRASGRTPAVSESPSSEGDWLVRETTSALTDETTVILSLRSNEVHQCRIGGGHHAVLAVRCIENTTSLIVTTNCHMTSSRYDNYGVVDYRIDDIPAESVSMEPSTSRESLGLWRGNQSIPIVRKMFGHERLILRMRPYGQNMITSEFNISGLETAIEPLREACNW